jgi:hypothetical protein
VYRRVIGKPSPESCRAVTWKIRFHGAAHAAARFVIPTSLATPRVAKSASALQDEDATWNGPALKIGGRGGQERDLEAVVLGEFVE